MSDSDADGYEYDSDPEEDDDDDGQDVSDFSRGGSSSSSPSVGLASSGASPKKLLGNCADGEVRLLHMGEIIPPMQSKIGQIADLLDVPAAGAAALLRHAGWSQEKLTDSFWSDAEKVLTEAGIVEWKKSADVSTIGTTELFVASPPSSGSAAHSSLAAGTQEGAEGSGLQSRTGTAPKVGISLGLPTGYCGVAMHSPSDVTEETVTCRICFMDVPPSEAMASPCGHFFCCEDYQAYLETKLGEGPSVVFTTCPEHKCPCLVPPEVWVQALGDHSSSSGLQVEAKQSAAGPAAMGGGGGGGGVCSESGQSALLAKYSRMILEQFVSNNKQMRWCPAPGCERVIMAGAGVANVRCGPGGCGKAFCFKCGEEAHQPAACPELVLWLEKCQNESETANWILANTKRCPKCTTRIEKNQGCNHITCSQCKFEFCWMCMGNWADHGATTGGYYKCNKFDPDVTEGPDDAAGRAKRELDRYLHYFKRYQAHHSAQLFAEKQLLITEKRMGELQESTGSSSWIDVQFLKTANESVIECRRTLKYTYVFGFYLTSPKSLVNEDAAKHRDLFENMQEDLERYTELVSELTEMPIEKMVLQDNKESIINNTRVVEKFLANLIQGCDEGLDEIGKGAAQIPKAQTGPLSAAAEDSVMQAALSASLKPGGGGKKRK